MRTYIGQSIPLVLLLSISCQSPPSAADRLAQRVALDSALFAAVVDSVRSQYGGPVFGVAPVPLDMDSALVSGSDSVRAELTRITAERSAVLAARHISILKNASAGKCPPIFSGENTAELCPAKSEERIAVGLARAWKDSALATTMIAMGVLSTGIDRSGASMGSANYVLEPVNGGWRVVKIIYGLVN